MHLQSLLDAYEKQAGAGVDPALRRLLSRDDIDPADRRTRPGHLTASGIVVDPSRGQVLLIYHRFLRRWLQPGGHLDPGERPIDAARREVAEETGLRDLPLIPLDPTRPMGDQPQGDRPNGDQPPGPIHIDSHAIPANPAKNESAHTHHDFRYAFHGDATRPLLTNPGEVLAAQWMQIDDPRIEPTIQSIARHALDLHHNCT